jgi:hypothetical protein
MSVEFTIEGLNERQRCLADIIWACKDFADVQKFIKTLPTHALRDEAYSIVELMKMAAVEQCYDGIAKTTEAKDVLNQFTL